MTFLIIDFPHDIHIGMMIFEVIIVTTLAMGASSEESMLVVFTIINTCVTCINTHTACAFCSLQLCRISGDYNFGTCIIVCIYRACIKVSYIYERDSQQNKRKITMEIADFKAACEMVFKNLDINNDGKLQKNECKTFASTIYK